MGSLPDKKLCPECEVWQPRDQYYISSKGKYMRICIPCKGIYDKQPKIRYNQATHRANQRDIEWHLTMDEFIEFSKHPCHYCNGPLPRTGMGIDRKSEKIGYTVDNCVSCCAVCNFVKHRNFSFDEMKVIGRAVAEIRIMRGLAPNVEMRMTHQSNRMRRPYRPRRPGGAKVHGYYDPLPARKDNDVN